jgi:hypothetical protein
MHLAGVSVLVDVITSWLVHQSLHAFMNPCMPCIIRLFLTVQTLTYCIRIYMHVATCISIRIQWLNVRSKTLGNAKVSPIDGCFPLVCSQIGAEWGATVGALQLESSDCL